jgi:hypothetical protein
MPTPRSPASRNPLAAATILLACGTACGQTVWRPSDDRFWHEDVLPRFTVPTFAGPLAPPPGGMDAVVDAHWTTATSGDWFDFTRWSTNPEAPNNGSPSGTTYHAYIDAVGPAYTVGLAAAATIDALTLNSSTATLSVGSGGVLSVLGGANINAGRLRVDGGTINGGAYTFAGGTLTAGTTADTLLDGVTINGSVTLGDAQLDRMLLRIHNGLTLNGTMTLGGGTIPRGTSLVFEGDQTLTTGAYVLSGAGFTRDLSVDGTATLTLGPAVTVRGGNGVIGSQVLTSGQHNTVINQGLIRADDIATRPISIVSHTFTNSGTVEATGTGVVSLNSPNWSNTGTLNVSDTGVLNLGGGFTTAGLGTVTRSGGTINITGAMDNTGSTFTLDATTGDYFLRGGTITGGTVTQAGGSLRPTNFGPNRLNGVIVNGDLDMLGGSINLTLAGANTLNGTAHMGLNARLTAEGAASLSAGTIAMQNASIEGHPTSSLTLGSGAVISTTPRLSPAGPATNTIGGGLITNQGLISATGSGNTTRLEPLTLNNQGTIEVLNGGLMSVGYQLQSTFGVWSNSGLIRVDNGTLVMRGTVTTPNLGTIQRTGGTIGIEGVVDNTGSTLTFDSGTGSWQLRAGEIRGGTLNFTQGAGLDLTPTAASGSVGGTLRGLTVNGDITLGQGPGSTVSGLAFYDGIGMNGTIRVGGESSVLTFRNTQSFNSGTIWIDGPSGANRLVSVDAGATVTLGENVWVHGGGGAFTWLGAGSSIVNHGRITSDIAGRTLTVGGSPLMSDGVLEVLNGATMSLTGAWTSTGIIRNNGGTLNFNGTGRLAGSTFEGTGGVVNVLGAIDNANAAITLTGPAQSWNMNGGRINGGTVNLVSGATLNMTGTSTGGGTLSNATLNGDITLLAGPTSPTLAIERTLNLNGTITLGGNSTTMFVRPGPMNPVTINGGTIFLAGDDNPGAGSNRRQTLDFGSPGLFTLGPTATIRGGGTGSGGYTGSAIGRSAPTGTAFGLINKGLISADLTDQHLTIQTTTLSNEGIMEAVNGGTLHITHESSWTNTGLIRSSPGSTVILGGRVSTPGLGTVLGNGGAVTLGGTLDNMGFTLNLNQSTGSWGIRDGMIKGGTVAMQDGARLLFPQGSGYMDGVTVNGDLEALNGGGIDIRNGLTLNGTAYLSGSNSVMRFNGIQAFPSGTVVFEGSSGGLRTLYATSGGTLTLGSAATVRGGNGQITTGSTSTVVNQGLISADVSGQSISIYSARFMNEGTVQAVNGGIITYIPPFSPEDPVFINHSLLRVDAGSIFEWAGPFVQSAGGVMSVHLSGSETPSGRILLLNTVDLAGMLRVTADAGFMPSVGQQFAILSLSPSVLTGVFDHIDLPSLGGGLSWDTSQVYSSGTIGVVPSPGTLVILGLSGLALRRRRQGATP